MAAGTLSLAVEVAGVLVVLVLVAALAYGMVRRRRRTAGTRSAPPQAPAPSGQPAATWAPPRQPSPQPPATGPSLSVGIMLVRPAAGGLEVSWTALVDGSEPVAVFWGPPAVEVTGDVLELRYACAPGPGFREPRTRCYNPREMVSRVAMVPWPAVGRGPAGLAVRVSLAYGPAAGLETALAGQDSFMAWQQIATTRARPVPKA